MPSYIADRQTDRDKIRTKSWNCFQLLERSLGQASVQILCVTTAFHVVDVGIPGSLGADFAKDALQDCRREGHLFSSSTLSGLQTGETVPNEGCFQYPPLGGGC